MTHDRLELLTIDPSSWEVYAKDQMFQKAEDRAFILTETHIHMHTHIHARTHTRTHARAHTRVHPHTHANAQQTHVDAHIHVSIIGCFRMLKIARLHTHTHTYARTRTYAQHPCTHTFTSTYA